MGEVADLFGVLGLKVNESEWATGDAVIDRARKQLLKYQVAHQQKQDRAANASRRAVDRLAREEAMEARSQERTAARGQTAANRAINSLQRDATREAALRTRKEAAERRSQAAIVREKERTALKTKRIADRESAETERQFKGYASRAQGAGLLLGGLALYLGERVVTSGIKFNATMEESKNQIAGMLALTKKTHLAQEMGNADTLVANLQRRAATLPGTTAEYVAMLSNITRPIMDAKLSMKDLEDITVNSVVAAKAFGINAMVAARDIDQALRGSYHSVDPFSGKVLGALGYKGEEGRSRYNQLSEAKRAAEFKRGLLLPQITELAAAQGASFTGVLSTLDDAWEQFKGRLTRPLFEVLGASIVKLNKWLDDNKVKIGEVTDKIGGALVTAFNFLGKVIDFFVEHGDLALSILIAIGATLAALAIAWVVGFWPIFAIIAALTLLTYGLKKLMDYPGGVRKAFEAAFDAIISAVDDVGDAIEEAFQSAFDAVAKIPIIGDLLRLVAAIERLTSRNQKPTPPGEREPSKFDAEGILGKVNSVLKFMTPGGMISGVRDILPGPTAKMLAPGSGGGSTNVTVGDVNVSVTAPNADSGAVADAVGRHLDAKLGNILRDTMDKVR